MSAPQILIQAAAHRLAARFGSGLADTAAALAEIAQDAPLRLQKEWSLFWEEVEREAERIEGRESHSAGPAGGVGSHHGGFSSGTSATGGGRTEDGPDPQARIDALRARVAGIARSLEEPVRGRP